MFALLFGAANGDDADGRVEGIVVLAAGAAAGAMVGNACSRVLREWQPGLAR
jgi:hypothetical protein